MFLWSQPCIIGGMIPERVHEISSVTLKTSRNTLPH